MQMAGRAVLVAGASSGIGEVTSPYFDHNPWPMGCGPATGAPRGEGVGD
jgi:NADP-dependent 3-hydroxy acid dehydrogenase YdfG